MNKENKEKYYEAVGRRKTSVARVRLFQGGDGIEVNGKDFNDYFKTGGQLSVASSALKKVALDSQLKATIKVKGGGLSAQAEAVRHGLSRALLKFDNELRGKLKAAGFLTRDQRMVERKKYGLKKARRAPQWSKR